MGLFRLLRFTLEGCFFFGLLFLCFGSGDSDLSRFCFLAEEEEEVFFFLGASGVGLRCDPFAHNFLLRLFLLFCFLLGLRGTLGVRNKAVLLVCLGGGLCLLGLAVGVQGAALHKEGVDAQRILQLLVLLHVCLRHLVALLHNGTPGLVLGNAKVQEVGLLLEHLAEFVHLGVNLLLVVPLLLHHLLQLEALDLEFALALVVQDLLVRLAVHLGIQPLDVLLRLVVHLVLGPLHEGQVALHVSIGAAATRRLQPNAVVHGAASQGLL
uniref:Uncharacterized protein n=1 Tax=Ixodes ricinus TaxID=34613 RepID=A0A6B0V680_IXORI